MKTIITEKAAIKRKLPVNYSSSDLPFFKNELEKTIPEAAVYNVKNCFVNSRGIVVQGISVRKESLVSNKKKYGKKFLLQFFLKGFRILHPKKNYLLTFNELYDGHFHWITEMLPRLYMVKDQIKNRSVLLPEKLSSNQQQSLEPFQIENKTCLKNGSNYFARKLILPGHLARSGNYNETIIRKTGSFISDYFKGNSRVGEKIYVSRKNAPVRKIVNEDELTPILQKYDFSIIRFEDFSFKEQVVIAKKTKYLIGIHGAGLVNMMFMNPGTSVFELRKEGDTSNLCYFSLASALNIHYYYQFGKPVNPLKTTWDADLIIDPDLFEKNIKLMLGYA